MKSLPQAIDFYFLFSANLFHIVEEDLPEFQIIERFLVLMCSKTSTLSSVNRPRKELFFQRNENAEHIPPCANSLYQHTLRALYQAGIWSSSLRKIIDMPNPESYA